MKLVYGITVSTEIEEIKRLLDLLTKNTNSTIVVQCDETKVTLELIDVLKTYNVTITQVPFCNDFAAFKNKLTETCKELGAEVIFQLDADEMISEYLINFIPSIVEMNPSIDLFYLPRINTVEGITEEHLKKWKWTVNELGHINFPDPQGRVYRPNLLWEGKVHEKINTEKFGGLPMAKEYCILHHKTIETQEKQNSLYTSLS